MLIQRRRNSGPRPQYGAAMIIMMLIIVLGLIGLFTYRLDRKAPEQKADRQTALALAQAKEALLGNAAANADPGTLPCPSMDGKKGRANTVTVGGVHGIRCGSTTIKSNFGWLPWYTLHLGDLREGSKNLLWYMLGSGYVDKGSYSPPPRPTSPLTVTVITVDINPSDFSETVLSSVTYTDIAAVVLAPGAPLQGQNRSGTAETDSSYFPQYFEGAVDSAADTITIKVEKQHNYAKIKYNDQFVLIAGKEVLDRSTPLVSQSVAVELENYYKTSGAFPSSSSWIPSSSDWVGNGKFVPWITPVGAVMPITYTNTSSDPTKCNGSCVASADIQFDVCASVYAVQENSPPVAFKISRSSHC